MTGLPVCADYPLARDGFVARPSGAWAEDKLHYVGRYMFVFSRGMKNRWQDRTFVDLLAGPGRGVVEDPWHEFDGSPIRAVDCKEPFSRVILVEQDAQCYRALKHRIGTRATILNKDCNDPATIDEIRRLMPPNSLCLAFVDNLGLDVPFATLERLTQGRRVDLLITFQVGDLARNLKDVLEGRDDPRRWDAFFGDQGWNDLAVQAFGRNEPASEIATRLMLFYGERLGAIEYPCVGHSHTTMKNRKNVALYRLLLASRHPKAVELFEAVSQIEPGGQRRLKFPD